MSVDSLPILLRVPLGLTASAPLELQERFKKRERVVEQLVDYLGVSIITVPEERLMDPACFQNLCAHPDNIKALWWGGRSAFLPETTVLYSNLCARLSASGLPSNIVHEHPNFIEESFNQRLYYSLIEQVGVPQPQTTFVELPELDDQNEAQDIRDLLEQKIAQGDAFDEPCFLRTFYGTRKVHPGLNFTFSRESLINKAVDLIYNLQLTQPVGGLAIREALDIQTIRQEDNLFCEFRVFAVDKKPLMWFVDSQMEKSRAFFEQAHIPFLNQEQVARIGDYAARIASVLQSRFLCLDFAVLSDQSIVLLEVNPGHSSGWVHDMALVGVYGQLFRKLAGLDFMTTETCVSVVSELGIDPWGYKICYDFL